MFLTNQSKFKKPKSGLFAFPPKIIIYISWENFFVHKILILTYLNTHISNFHSLNIHLSLVVLILIAIKYTLNVIVKINYIFNSEMMASLL